MTTLVLYLVIVAAVTAVLFLLAALVFGRGEGLPPIPKGASPTDLPASGVTAADVRALRFRLALRGYRMSDVDWALAQLAREIDALRAQLAADPGAEALAGPAAAGGDDRG